MSDSKLFASYALFAVLFLLPVSLAAAAEHTVVITDNKFTPKDITIKVGDKIIWTNKGEDDHTATANKKDDPNFFDTDVLVPKASSKPIEFKKAGTVPYHCGKHPSTMKGTITVMP